MASITTVIYECDRCGTQGDIASYTLARGRARPKAYDLCPTCAAPIGDIIGTNGGQVPLSAPRAKVFSMEEIEETKRKTAPQRKRKGAVSGSQGSGR